MMVMNLTDETLTRQLKVLRKGGRNFKEVFRIATQIRKNMSRLPPEVEHSECDGNNQNNISSPPDVQKGNTGEVLT